MAHPLLVHETWDTRYYTTLELILSSQWSQASESSATSATIYDLNVNLGIDESVLLGFVHQLPAAGGCCAPQLVEGEVSLFHRLPRKWQE